MLSKLFNLFRSKPSIVSPSANLVQVGGRLLDISQWSPELVEALKNEYFMPSCKDAYMMRVDLSAGCPEGHTTTERVGVFTKSGDLTNKITEDLNKIRIIVTCKQCGKPARITGKRVAWQGDLGTWDGVI